MGGGVHNKLKTVSSAPSSSNIRIGSEHIRHTDLVRREIRSALHSFLYICGTTPRMEGQFHPYHGFLPLQDTDGENINRQRNRGTCKTWAVFGTIWPRKYKNPFPLRASLLCGNVPNITLQACCGFRRTHFRLGTNWWKKLGTTELCLACNIRVHKCSKNLAANSDF